MRRRVVCTLCVPLSHLPAKNPSAVGIGPAPFAIAGAHLLS